MTPARPREPALAMNAAPGWLVLRTGGAAPQHRGEP